MKDFAVRPVRLVKTYRIGGEDQGYGTPWGTFAQAERRLRERLSSPHPNKRLAAGRQA